MSKFKNGPKSDNIHGWPYAFENWLKRVGIKNGQLLTPMDIYALQAYRTDWDELGISAPIYYSRRFQEAMERDDPCRHKRREAQQSEE